MKKGTQSLRIECQRGIEQRLLLVFVIHNLFHTFLILCKFTTFSINIVCKKRKCYMFKGSFFKYQH